MRVKFFICILHICLKLGPCGEQFVIHFCTFNILREREPKRLTVHILKLNEDRVTETKQKQKPGNWIDRHTNKIGRERLT